MLHLDAGVLEPHLDGVLAVLRAPLEALAQLADRGRQDENGHHVRAGPRQQLHGALPVDVEQDIAAPAELFLDVGAWRSVEISMHLSALEQLALGPHALEIGHLDEVVMHAFDLVSAARSRGHRNRQ